MIPQQVLSSTAIPGPFLPPDNRPREALRDYELGGVALADPSQGLQVKTWTFEYHDGAVYVSADDVDEVLLFSWDDVTAIAGAFDQNMRAAVAFVADGQLTLWWFDTFLHMQVFTNFDGEQPRLSLDDKRDLERGTSDLILSYLRGDALYFRAQRNRFTQEYLLAADVSGFTLEQAGMNTVDRYQWYFKPIPQEPGP